MGPSMQMGSSNQAIRVSGPVNDAGLVMSFETGRLAQLADGGMDLSGRRVAVALPPEAQRVLGRDWALKHKVPQIELRTWLIPDWEYPGYWLLKDNQLVSAAGLAEAVSNNTTNREKRAVCIGGPVMAGRLCLRRQGGAARGGRCVWRVSY